MSSTIADIPPLDASRCLSQPTFQQLCAALAVTNHVLSFVYEHDPLHELWNEPIPPVILKWLPYANSTVPQTVSILPGWYIVPDLEKVRILLAVAEQLLWTFFIRRSELKDDAWPEQQGDEALKLVPDVVLALQVASKVKLDVLTTLPEQFDEMVRQFVLDYLSDTLTRHHSDIRNNHNGAQSCSMCTHIEWARLLLHHLDQRGSAF